MNKPFASEDWFSKSTCDKTVASVGAAGFHKIRTPRLSECDPGP